jgi:hypothetical protein
MMAEGSEETSNFEELFETLADWSEQLKHSGALKDLHP